jgi:glycosyltransferase involved in cell wall biosynthesis
MKTLLSIDNQKLPEKSYKDIQVIVVDDASTKPVKSII